MVFFIIVLALVVPYGMAIGILYLRQRKLQYSPTHRDLEGKGTARFRPWVEKGEFLGYLRAGKSASRVVLVFHGSTGEALDREWVDTLVSAGEHLVLAEYPGYGARGGKTTEDLVLADAERIVEAVRSRWNLPVIAVGESLGSAVVAYLASRGKIDRMALLSPFVSTEKLAARRFRLFPVKWMLKDKYPTLKYLQSAAVPLHIVHGTLDELVPLSDAKTVFQAYPGQKKELEEVPGFGHALADALLHSPFTLGFREFLAESF